MALAGTRAVTSWKIDLTRRAAELTTLATRLAELDVQVARFEAPASDGQDLASMMRRQGAEVRRQHAVNAFIECAVGGAASGREDESLLAHAARLQETGWRRAHA
jgi:hypothetical protein